MRGGRVLWTDELRGAPPLALEQVDLLLQSSTWRHAARLDATPPAGFGERFTRGWSNKSLNVHDGAPLRIGPMRIVCVSGISL